MIFPTEDLAGIINGQTRHALWPIIPGAPAPEGVHRVQRRGGSPVCHIRILTATAVQLDSIDHGDARAAGYPTLAVYRDAWCRAHWEAWTGQSAWLLEFQLERKAERTRFLAVGGDDYTFGKVSEATPSDLAVLDVLPDDAAQDRARRAYRAELARTLDDAESVDPAELVSLRFVSEKAWRKELQLREAEFRALPIQVAAQVARRDAKVSHVNLSGEDYVLQRMLNDGRTEEALERHRERIAQKIRRAA